MSDNTPNEDNENISGNWERNEQMIRDKIVHILTLCPTITPSMLQVGLGPGLAADFWRPVLERMVSEGVLYVRDVSHTTPKGRAGTMKLISLR